jgi:hypothetical protein
MAYVDTTAQNLPRKLRREACGKIATLAGKKLMARLWDFVNACGPVALALMAAALALWPRWAEGNARFIWAISFLVVGAICTAAAFRSSNYLSDLITGGENYCYFKIRLADAGDLSGPFQLWMIAPKGPVYEMNYWISPASAKGASDPAYGSLDVRKPLHTIIHEGGHAWDKALGEGDYLIEFDAKNGHWNERLRIFVDATGELKQTIKIAGFGGKTLYEGSPL